MDMGVVLRIDVKDTELDVNDDRMSAPDKDEHTMFEIVHSDDVVLSCFFKCSRPAWVVVLKLSIGIDDEDDDRDVDKDEHFETMHSDDDEDDDKLLNTEIGVLEISKVADIIVE